jgi:catechol 2,3-dioxygenase-like lactoylglutathione lyase family enzyme
MDMRLEVVVLPVSDVDRAKDFYADRMGFRLDADLASDDNYRVVQVTPPGSGCSVIFGTGVTTAKPGSVQGLHLVASDIEQARAELVSRGVDVGDPDAESVSASFGMPAVPSMANSITWRPARACRDRFRRDPRG